MVDRDAVQQYFAGAQFVHFLLGPTTVSLAMPIRDSRHHILRAVLPILAALLAGSATAILSVLAIAYGFGIRGEARIKLAPKSATAPVALGISEALGGSPSLTAVLVILTGITGAVGPRLC